MDFFKFKDLEFAAKWADKQYDKKDPKHKKVKKRIISQLWDKTGYWSNQLESKLPGFNFQFTKKWLDRSSNGKNSFTKFRGGTWVKIIPKTKADAHIFFTIGIHAESKELVYKIDFKHGASGHISKKHHELLKSIVPWELRWVTIKPEQLIEYNWSRLIDESASFISKHENYLNQLIDSYDHLNEKQLDKKISELKHVDERLMRLTWNDFSWIKPSGHKWPIKGSTAYENLHGFGHEEWLMNDRFDVDGLQYGYIRAVEGLSPSQEYIEKVYLYSLNPNDKKRSLVGYLENVEIIEGFEEVQEQIKMNYQRNFEYLENLLKDVDADWQIVRKEHKPNVRFDKGNATIFDKPINASFLKQPKYNRFTPIIVDAGIKDEINQVLSGSNTLKNTRLEFNPGQGSGQGDYDKAIKTSHKKISPLHKRISDALYDHLLTIGYSKNELSFEKSRVNNKLIDGVINRNNHFQIFEIKTSRDFYIILRESLGQALEYAILDNSISAKITIVGPAIPEKADIEYLKRLNDFIKIPISYWSYSLTRKQFIKYHLK